MSAPPSPPTAFATGTRLEVRDALLRLLGDARHALSVHSRDLAPGVLDDEQVLAALRRLAVSGRGASLRFLLHDPARVLREHHRLVPLAQRLPTAIALRVPVEDDDLAYAPAFALNDAGGYLLQPLAGHFDGRGSTHAPGQWRPLQRYFDEVWDRSLPADGLRPLGI